MAMSGWSSTLPLHSERSSGENLGHAAMSWRGSWPAARTLQGIPITTCFIYFFFAPPFPSQSPPRALSASASSALLRPRAWISRRSGSSAPRLCGQLRAADGPSQSAAAGRQLSRAAVLADVALVRAFLSSSSAPSGLAGAPVVIEARPIYSPPSFHSPPLFSSSLYGPFILRHGSSASRGNRQASSVVVAVVAVAAAVVSHG